MSPKKFPILGVWSPNPARRRAKSSIPWHVIAPHAEQAKKNHRGESLEDLAARGGLSHEHAVAIIERRPHRRMDLLKAEARLGEHIKKAGTKKPAASPP